MLCGSIQDWPRFFKQAYDNLTPGGTIELSDIIFPSVCDDGTLPEDSAVCRWDTLINDGYRGAGRPIDSALYYDQQLADAGFVDVGINRQKWPVNHWPKDKKHKQIGKEHILRLPSG